MQGNIYIIGQIGNSYKEDGSINAKGVELVDVVNQLEPLSECENINVWINSGGGLVETGHQIAEYLATKSNVTTIADEFCASIATEIHLSVPVAKRKVVAGTQYMIHNPLFPQITNANANDLREMADVLDPIQEGLVKMYTKQTGTSKEAIQALMNVEASLTDEQLVTLGFVSEIINKVQLKAVAFIDPKDVINKQSNMSKIKLGLYMKAMAMVKGREVKAIIEEVEQGTIETPFSDLMPGDPIMLGEVAAPADTYVLADGTKIVVVDEGVISEIIPAASDDAEPEEVLNLKAKLAELEAENVALKAENEVNASAIAQMETEHEATLVVLNELEQKRSTFKPAPAATAFRKPAEVTKTAKELMAERKAAYKSK